MNRQDAIIQAINHINIIICKYSKFKRPIFITEIKNIARKEFVISVSHDLHLYQVKFSYFNNIFTEQPIFDKKYQEGMGWLKHQIILKEKMLEVQENE